MLTRDLKTIFTRDLGKLKKEIASYRNEKNLWKLDKEISNSAGNLCLHLVGNLNTYIGANLGNTGYVRQRDLEFSSRDIPRTELIHKIEDTISTIDRVFDSLSDAQLKEEYPHLVLEEKTSTEFLMIHLAAHLSYHLGQINYHRRLLDFTSNPL
jgi:uncharacterized damage-inducible protein DinB